MIDLLRPLRAAAKRFPPIAAVARQVTFLRQRAAHLKFIRSYRSRDGRSEVDRFVENPLLIGYFEAGFGLGEQARGLASALEAASVPFAVYPYHSFLTGRLLRETPWASRYDVDNIHAINVFCMAVDQTPNALKIIGRRHFENSYNIIYTAWELSRAPEAWRADLEFFDELWALSSFATHSFQPIFSKPAHTIPLCINVPAAITGNRKQFRLNAGKFYFLFFFDYNSYPERKNPLAVVKAFETAFRDQTDDVGLILKTTGAPHEYPDVEFQLKSAAKRDSRITLLHGDWPRADVLSLLASVNCFVSLHRSEGFGLGMAEAMALGKPVIATNFSSNVQFLNEDTGYPVPYRIRSVEDQEYPHAAGNVWAEPEVSAAVEFMRHVVRNPDEARKKALQGQVFVRQHFNPKTIGNIVTERLRTLGNGSRLG